MLSEELDASAEQAQRLTRRIDLVVGLLAASQEPIEDPAQSFIALERALETTELGASTAAWLALVGATGSYRDGTAVDIAARVLRLDGPSALRRHVEALYSEAIEGGQLLPEVEVLRDRVVVDVTHTSTHDFHTGIQRVTRECVSRWLTRPDVELIHWSHRDAGPKRLSEREIERMERWRDHLHRAGDDVRSREPDEATGHTVIPWGCILVVPEFVDSSQRSEGYAALATAGITSGISLIGYDLTPVTASEYFEPDLTQTFVQFLRLVKHASDICAISESAAQEFRSFLGVLRSQGMAPPNVTAAPLTSVASPVDDDTLDATRRRFDVGERPLVVVVGSHEPRKNHLNVLEAAHTLWRQGLEFDLVFGGGSTWRSAEFQRYADQLRSEGRRVQVHQRVSEDELWSLYRLADFTVFVSFLEGYGLPVAESLASGTPVITTNYGSMAEIAAGGGALQVDPRNPEAIAGAMHQLLTDERRLDILRAGVQGEAAGERGTTTRTRCGSSSSRRPASVRCPAPVPQRSSGRSTDATDAVTKSRSASISRRASRASSLVDSNESRAVPTRSSISSKEPRSPSC